MGSGKDGDRGEGQAGQQQDSADFHDRAEQDRFSWGGYLELLRKQAGRSFIYFGVGIGYGENWFSIGLGSTKFPFQSFPLQMHLFLGTGVSTQESKAPSLLPGLGPTQAVPDPGSVPL